MQQGDYTSPPYYQYHPQSYQPPPTAAPPIPPSYASAPSPASYASAPPYAAADYSSYPQNYPPFPHNIPDHTPPTAPPPLYTPPPPPPPSQPTPPDSHVPHNSQFQNYPPYDPNYPSPNYPPLTTATSYPNPNSSPHEKSYDSAPKYDHGQGYFGEKLSGYGSFGSSRSNLGGGYDYPDPNPIPNPSLTGKSYDNAPKYGNGQGYYEENLGGYGSFGSSRSTLGGGYDFKEYKDEGVYAYEGKNEPYGARGTATLKSSNWSGLFDDYGRAISFPKEKEKSGSSGSSGALKVVRAVPKAEDKTDAKSGVQKFRVKLLPESGGHSVLDVLCMVGLDGIRMLDPNTSRTLRIYPLETVTRCDKIDSSTFAFWSKTSVDVEARRIRLQSNSYTTNTILDTVTAATVQFKEMGGRARPTELPRAVEQAGEKKKGLTDWINRLKPVNEEKDHWVPDEVVSKCTGCGSDFSAFNRRHHCRNCGDVFCDKCTQGRTPLTAEENAQPVRVCDRCMAEVTHRLSKAKENASRPVTLQSHEDLAKKLQEEMEKNLKISSGSKSEGSGRRMREVACPTCTVHLQVQVPSSGSETIECGVCQHPFLVSAH